MADIVTDFNAVDGRNKYGNISVPKADKLLDGIIEFLKNGHSVPELNGDFLKKFIDPSAKYDDEMRENLSKLVHFFDIPKDKIEKLTLDDSLIGNQLDVGKLINIVKNHLASENLFMVNVFKNYQGMNEKEIIVAIEKINNDIFTCNTLIGQIQKSSNNMNEIIHKDFSDVKIEKSECSKEYVTFGVTLDIEKKQEELDKIKKTLSEKESILQQKKDIGKIEADLLKSKTQMSEMCKKFNAKDGKDLIEKLENINEVLRLTMWIYKLNGVGGSEVGFDDIMIRLFNNILRHMMQPVHAPVTDPQKIVEILSQYKGKLQNKDAPNEKIMEIINHQIKGMANRYRTYVNKNPRVIQAYKDKLELYESISKGSNPKNITIDMIEKYYLSLVMGDLVVSVPIVSKDDLFMFIWNNLKIDEISDMYKKYTLLTRKMDDKYKKLTLSEAEKQKKEITKLIDDAKKLQETINGLEDLIRIMKSEDLDATIINLKKKMEVINSELRDIETSMKRMNDEIEKDLTITISIFKKLSSHMNVVNKFYYDTDKMTDGIDKSFDISSRTMNGGANYSLTDFMKIIKENVNDNTKVYKLLMEYCQKSSTLKSRYTVMYNKLKEFNKSVINVVLFNLFKLTTFRDMNNGTVKIGKYITIKELKEMRENVNLWGTNKNNLGQYVIMTNIANKLLGRIFELSQFNDEECINLENTKHILDFILVINFCKNIERK